MRKIVEAIVCLLLCSVFLLCGCAVPLQAVYYLAFGWVHFLYRVVPQLTVNPVGVVTAVVCLVSIGLGLRFFVRSLVSQAQPALADSAISRRNAGRWSLVLLLVVVSSFLAGISAVGVAHQTAWLITSPESLVDGGLHAAPARMSSSNNLKYLGLAEHDYHDQRHTLTPGGVFDSRGRALHGWQTLLLPYMDEKHLYESINLQLPWNAPENARHFKVPLRVFCYRYTRKEPEVDADGHGLSHYAANSRLLGRDTPLSLQQIGGADRLGSTILAGEAAGHYKPWGYPTNWRDPAVGINQQPSGFGNPLGKGANFLFCDGSVRFLNNHVSPEVLKALSTPDARVKIEVPSD